MTTFEIIFKITWENTKIIRKNSGKNEMQIKWIQAFFRFNQAQINSSISLKIIAIKNISENIPLQKSN